MDRKRTVKRNLAMLLVLSFLLALGGAAGFADGEDVTEPVEVYANEQTGSQSEAVGSVTVAEVEKGTEAWPTVIAQAKDGQSAEVTVSDDVSGSATTGETLITTGVVADTKGEDSSAEVAVGGNVTTEGLEGAGGFAVQSGIVNQGETASNAGAESSVTVGGDVSAEATGEGSQANGGMVSATNGGSAAAEVGGDLSAEADSRTVGIDVAAEGKDAEASASIGGDVTAEAKTATAVGENVWAWDGAAASLTVEGDVKVSGIGGGRDGFGATGAHVGAQYTEASADALVAGSITVTATDGRALGASVFSSDGGEAALTVGGDIIAEATGDGNGPTKLPALANGVNLMTNEGGSSELSVGGDLIASGMGGTGLAIDVASDSEVKAEIAGDLSGQEQGLWVRTLDLADNKDASVEVTVGGTLSAKSDEGTAVVVSEGVTPDNLKLTVWKIDLDQNDNAVVQKSYNAETGVMSSEVTETTRAIEQSIQYIIKIEPTQTDVFKGTQKTAKEGENAAVKVNIPEGFKLDGAFTDEGKQVELLKDAEGNYYVIMPKGGGVYLSAKLSEIPAPAPEEPEEPAKEPAEEPSAAPAVVPAVNDKEKAQETQAAEKAETEAVKAIAETSAAAEDGESVVVANGTLDGKTATKEMKTDFEALTGKLVDAGKALSADVRAAIPAEIRSDAAGDAPLRQASPSGALPASIRQPSPSSWTIRTTLWAS